MNALHELQIKCYDAFALGHESSLEGETCGCGVVESIGHLVYRNNVIESTLKTLGACYPVILRLVGRECLRTLGRDYRTRFPSTSGNLDAFGESFPQFLAGLYQDSPYDYLADIAQLEWTISRLVDRSPGVGANLDCLHGLDAEQFAQLQWRLGPTVAIVRSAYPIHQIWSANVTSDDEVIVDLNAGGESVLVTAHGLQPLVHLISTGCAEFVDELSIGATIGQACDAALAMDPAFDLSAALQLLVHTGAVATIVGARNTPPHHTEGIQL